MHVVFRPETRGEVLEVQDKLPHFPKCGGVKTLVNHQHGYRLRVGNYRVLFNFEGTITLVRIEEVGKRDERTY